MKFFITVVCLAFSAPAIASNAGTAGDISGGSYQISDDYKTK
jgi:hypothetical protein